VKVMLVTQQPEVRRIVEEAITGSEDTLVVAADLAAGLATSVEQAPEIAIVDVTLAGGAALAMVHHVIASSPRTSIYILAGPGSFEVAGEALSLGASGLIVAPPTGDAILRAIGEVHAKVGSEDRALKLASEVRDATELIDAMTQALNVAKAGDARALGETLLALFLIASGARGVAVYGEEDRQGVRKRIAGYGTALELLDRYNDLELAQLSTSRGGEVIGLAVDARMFGCVLIEKPDPMRTARVHRVIEFATALLPLCALARTAMAEDTTAPRSRALPANVFERLVQRDVDSISGPNKNGRELTLLCALAKGGEVDTGPLGPALALPGAAIGTNESGDVFVLMPKTPRAAARVLLLDVGQPVGLASSPGDGKSATTLLQVARARALRASRAPQMTRELRDRSLADVLSSIMTIKHSGVAALDIARDALDSMILHACRHARAMREVEVFVAHGSDTGAVTLVRQTAGDRAKVTDVKLQGSPGTLAVLVLGARASWALVMRERDGRTYAVHTSDAILCELLRARMSEGVKAT
jgi:ActR/RegA family two-component response regulator